MKKLIKLTALLLMLVLTVGMVCGCASTDGEEEEKVLAELTVGLPYNSESANWAALQAMIDDFEMMNDAVVTLVEVPAVGTEEYTKFIDKVYDGKVDIFLSSSNEEIQRLVEDKKIAPLTSINSKDNRFYELMIENYKDLSRESNRLSYSVPFSGSFQGLFLNKDVFTQTGVAMPTDWATLNAAIVALKEKGVTPIAAGFADGAGYWLDEMVLLEGGTAEHSAIPSKGVINSWSRAVNNIKNFYNAGAFSANALTNTHDVAVAEFINDQAAMIVCSSMDLGSSADAENTVFMPFPKSTTGIKENGAYIGKTESAFYINQKSLSRNVDDTTALSGVMVELVNTYMGSADYYPDLFAADGQFPFIKDGSDAMNGAYEEGAYEIIQSAEAADVTMGTYLLTFEEMKSGLIDVLNGDITVDEYLSEATAAEIKAQAEKKAEELEDKEK
ncbi:MAG: extracellular solute-binding protein [Clostridia bacterium]|nr:extracellular solute-binding protein [Clostridia bacterium]